MPDTNGPMKKILELVSTRGFDKFMAMIIIVTCIFLLGGVGIFYLITKTTIEPLGMIIGGVITTLTNLIGFYWGSSSSSRDKDDTINKMLNGKDN